MGSAFALPKCTFCVSSVFFFFFWSRNVWLFLWTMHGVHCSQTHKFHFSAIFSLKMDFAVLFTHLKIILLQYFSVFSFQLYPNELWARIMTNICKRQGLWVQWRELETIPWLILLCGKKKKAYDWSYFTIRKVTHEIFVKRDMNSLIVVNEGIWTLIFLLEISESINQLI